MTKSITRFQFLSILSGGGGGDDGGDSDISPMDIDSALDRYIN